MLMSPDAAMVTVLCLLTMLGVKKKCVKSFQLCLMIIPFHFQVAFYVSIIKNYHRSRNEILNIIYVNTVISGVLKLVWCLMS